MLKETSLEEAAGVRQAAAGGGEEEEENREGSLVLELPLPTSVRRAIPHHRPCTASRDRLSVRGGCWKLL